MGQPANSTGNYNDDSTVVGDSSSTVLSVVSADFCSILSTKGESMFFAHAGHHHAEEPSGISTAIIVVSLTVVVLFVVALIVYDMRKRRKLAVEPIVESDSNTDSKTEK
jgi:heme/copper-type cytochrome/quinol oxidase subunit 2